MRAVVYDTDGPGFGRLRTVELPVPEPLPGQVRVRVMVAAVNPTDWKARASRPGTRAWAWQVPGQDGAGVVDAVGDGVDPSRIGQRVWLYLAADGHALGSAAEYVCVAARRAVPLPDHVPFEIGASLGVPTLTAHFCLHADGPIAGRTVLVPGGGGAVGHAAVQIARDAGARVVTTVSSAEKASIAATAGPDVILDYRGLDFERRLRESVPEGIDRVVDVAVAVNVPTYLDLLNEGASIVGYATNDARPDLTLPVLELMRRNVNVRFMLLYGVPEPLLRDAASAVNRMLTEHRFVAMPFVTFPLEQLEAAHAAVRSGLPAKALIDLSGQNASRAS